MLFLLDTPYTTPTREPRLFEMSGPKEKGKKGGKKWDSEDVIQAVVIADSFSFRFQPITSEKPRALLPLVNRPLIDYTVEFLALSGVEEIFVYCCTHSDILRAHLHQSRWNKPSSSVKLHIIVSESCPSVGDALRDIDSQALIRSDFVLVSGDLVSNMDLREVIQKHKKLRERDKMVVMTNVYKRAAPNHRTRSIEDDILIATNSTSDRLLFCEKPDNKRRVNIPTTIFEENPEVEIHYDILDCHISVCAPTVPQLFSDNFDYLTRYHFIRGIIVNEEILGNSIYAHFISDQYAARVSNLQTYEAISKDVIHRWVYPLVPDISLLKDEAYSYGRHNIYLSRNVSLAFDCVLEEDVVLGSATSVGPQTRITHSSIGHNCRIGKGVVIEGCYIWDHVVIGDYCTLRKSILADNVELKPKVIVEDGCILSYNVVIGEGFLVSSGTRLTTNQNALITNTDDWEDESDKEEKKEVLTNTQKPECVEGDVGCGGKGFKWVPPQPDSDDDSDTFVFEKWHSSLYENNQQMDNGESLSGESSHSTSPTIPDPIQAESNMEDLFYHETLDYIRSGIVDSVTTENTILMINASKHAYNIPIDEVPLNIVRAILEGPQLSDNKELTKSTLVEYVLKAIPYYHNLLQHYIKGSSIQVSVLNTIADIAMKDRIVLSVFPKVVLELYNLDVIEEMAIFTWHDQLKSVKEKNTEHLDLLKHIHPVIEWLENAEEESDED